MEGKNVPGRQMSHLLAQSALIWSGKLPFAAAYLIHPPPSCHYTKPPIFRLRKSADGGEGGRGRGRGRAQRRRRDASGKKEGREENEDERRNFSRRRRRRRRHRQFSGRVSRHKIWRSLTRFPPLDRPFLKITAQQKIA